LTNDGGTTARKSIQGRVRAHILFLYNAFTRSIGGYPGGRFGRCGATIKVRTPIQIVALQVAVLRFCEPRLDRQGCVVDGRFQHAETADL
jgi:hypothetical protein